MAELPFRRSQTRWRHAGRAIVAAAAFVVVLYPFGGGYNPEGNWLRGPLWLVRTEASTADFAIGSLACAVLLPMMFAVLLHRNAATVALALVGIAIWIGFGAYLAMLAVV